MKKKDICPECSVYTLSIKSDAIDIIWDEQTRLKKNKIPQHKRTVEYLINKAILEWSGKEEDGVLTKTLSISGLPLSLIKDIQAKHKFGTKEDLSVQQAFNYIMADYNNLRNGKS